MLLLHCVLYVITLWGRDNAGQQINQASYFIIQMKSHQPKKARQPQAETAQRRFATLV